MNFELVDAIDKRTPLAGCPLVRLSGTGCLPWPRDSDQFCRERK